jgi:hypothetical protein
VTKDKKSKRTKEEEINEKEVCVRGRGKGEKLRYG